MKRERAEGDKRRQTGQGTPLAGHTSGVWGAFLSVLLTLKLLCLFLAVLYLYCFYWR